jgi:DNA processing protein
MFDPEVGMSEEAALVALLHARPNRLSWPEITAEVVAEGSAARVYQRLLPATLLPAPGETDPLAAAQQQIDEWRQTGLRFLTILDEAYPERLRGVHQAPPVLFARGRLLSDDPAVSVVGSRKASDRGLHIAGQVAAALARRQVTVLSGLAAGIDAAAHTAALAAGGRTVAVIGTGILGYYPKQNRALQDEISQQGLLLSQFWPEAPPRAQHFPMRNATMSGYGLATIVVEAGETSGARIQARVAVEHGRPVLLTDLVVQRNTWAQALVGRPGVHVVAGVQEVLSVVDGLLAEPQDVNRVLAQLASA